MPVKLLTSGGGGVNLVPSSSIASDQTMYLPTSGTSGGTVLCTDSTGGTANGVLYLNSSKQVTSGSGLTFDGSNLQFDSGYGSAATAYGCRAWVNFNGTGTVAIRASGNVSSITDNGTGDYTVNFTTAMPDANYATEINGEGNPSGSANFYLYGLQSSTSQASGSVRVSSFRNGAGVQDSNVINVAIFR